MRPVASAQDEGPYKGPLSFEIEDAAYFFGRDDDAALLLAKILSSRLTLVHAQSGAGKTSLLNARIIPSLEQHCATACRVLLRGNPTDAVRHTVLVALLPPPDAERAALDRVIALFWEAGDDPPLHEVLARCDAVRAESPQAMREALRPVDSSVEIPSAAFSYSGPVRPLLLRLLRDALEVSQYCEHLQAIVPAAAAITGTTRVSALRRLLTDGAAAEAHAQLLADLYVPSPSLLDFFANLVEQYGRRRTQFSLVLVLDQFEELFTLFSDAAASGGRQMWRLRWEFIAQLEQLYDARGSLPIRYVISMRDDYIAQLDPIRRFVRDLDASSFHLSLLERLAARRAIEAPARLFAYVYAEECYEDIFRTLVREDRFVEPAPLQIVCTRLWRDRERASAAATRDGEVRIITLTAFPLGGTAAILDSFLDEVFDAIGDAPDRAEALDVLEPLVTATGTRNIVALESLVHVPFRDPPQRLALLQALAARRVLRIEQRLGRDFVEISHEFLIAPILAKLRNLLNVDPVQHRFRSTLRALERFRDIEFRADSSRLGGRPLLQAAHEFSDLITWDGSAWAVEFLLRTAVAHGADPAVIRHWADRYATAGEPAPALVISTAWLAGRGGGLLTLEELDALDGARLEAGARAPVELVVRSLIRRGNDRHREHIVRWTRELDSQWQAAAPSAS